MKLIDGDALKEAISKHPLIDFTDDDLFKLIDNAPTVERPQGEWIIVNDVCCVCPFCENIEVKFSKYCPDCGARLKGGAE